jgi:hypothetical protein
MAEVVRFREEIVKRYDDAADIHLVTSLLRDLGAEVPSEERGHVDAAGRARYAEIGTSPQRRCALFLSM